MIVNIGLPIPSQCDHSLLCGHVLRLGKRDVGVPVQVSSIYCHAEYARHCRGAALVICKGAAILVPNETFKSFGRDDVFGFLPIPVVVAGCFLILAHIILTYTRFGTNVYALGSNEIAAQLSGINVNRTKTMVFMLSGFTAASGGSS